MDATAVLLAAHGYAVLLPSLPKPRDGPGVTAGLADRVLAIVAAAAADPELRGRFDADRLGLWGMSFGGYSTLAIVTQTDRFRAAIAEASMSDLFSIWGAFSLVDRIDPRHGLSPFYTAGWVEDVQPSTGAPPWADPQRYLFDSPALHADRVTTPVMLIHGELDGFPTSQPEEMFSGLLRQNKDAVLAIYWGENHGISSPGNLRDLYARGFQWLDDHLRPPVTAATARSADDRAPAPANTGRTPPSPRPRE
jgi:dipeptidyl aminopeptidase/acylaminoacyl peptidase